MTKPKIVAVEFEIVDSNKINGIFPERCWLINVKEISASGNCWYSTLCHCMTKAKAVKLLGVVINGWRL